MNNARPLLLKSAFQQVTAAQWSLNSSKSK